MTQKRILELLLKGVEAEIRNSAFPFDETSYSTLAKFLEERNEIREAYKEEIANKK